MYLFRYITVSDLCGEYTSWRASWSSSLPASFLRNQLVVINPAGRSVMSYIQYYSNNVHRHFMNLLHSQVLVKSATYHARSHQIPTFTNVTSHGHESLKKLFFHIHIHVIEKGGLTEKDAEPILFFRILL